MKLKQLLNWRFSLILFHRWIGIIIGLMFVIWSMSGVILMYYGIPHHKAGERLDHLATLDLSSASISPQQALESVGGNPFRLRVSMHQGRPVYRINTGFVFGRWDLVYADTGEVINGLGDDEAMAWLASSYPEYAETLEYEAYLERPDMYTHSPVMGTYMPLHRIATGDTSNTKYYVSEQTGEVVMKTTRGTRFLGFFGYHLHTWYFFRQQGWWTSTLHWLGWLGLSAAVLGLVLGIWRFSAKPKYNKRGVKFRTPYSGWMKWHHYTGLVFGTVMLTWVFSGLVSMSEIPGIEETLYTEAQIQAGARTVQGFGAYVDYAPLTVEGMQHAVSVISTEFPVKELELLYFNEQPYYYAYRSPTALELDHWTARSALDFITPTLDQEHLLISANLSDATPFSDFGEEDLMRAARSAMPEANVIEQIWLAEFDNYYYYGLSSFDLGLPKAVKTLPVLRVKFDDPEATWLYMSPSFGQMLKAETKDRLNRWGYYALHGYDYAFLYNNRPLWDIVVIILLLGCMGMSMTMLSPMFKRLAKHLRRLFKSGKEFF